MKENKNESIGLEEERFFSIELEGKSSLKSATLASSENNEVLVEGTIGKLMQAEFVEDVVLQVCGTKGILRINIKEKEIRIIVRAGKVSVAGAIDAVAGTGHVRGVITVSDRDIGVQIHAGLAGGHLRRRARGKCQYEQSENCDISTHSL